MIGDPQPRLHFVPGLSCGPTAVCAVTGVDAETATQAIADAALADTGKAITSFDKTRFRHQVLAVERLGYALFTRNNRSLNASQIGRPGRCWPASFLAQQLIMAEFLKSNRLSDVLICHAVKPTDGKPEEMEAHAFVVERDYYVDNSPDVPKPTPVAIVHSNVADFRVVEYFIVRPKSS